ncbi:DUF2316 family protein [Cryobacterium adonitolivorans]|uniref:DUF2316 family protein n=1 Tax=Cryobacterium adonitolivorans TaxID=1259189 RepID=A0A4R8W5Y5_9MICO|nr:DUF2316 family protein [Cryobacterium adonitolivorans]TFC01046.1 DUF2316 family protein [Cryobacterium adonitolivorans]
MSLNRSERGDTCNELNANLVLSGLTPENIGGALGWTLDRTTAALAVAGAAPRDVWLVRDYIDAAIIAAGKTPHPYSSLTEQMRSAADSWFGLIDVADVITGAAR